MIAQPARPWCTRHCVRDGRRQRRAHLRGAPGHEVVVIERNGAWVRVFANTDKPDQQDDRETPEFSADDTVTPASDGPGQRAGDAGDTEWRRDSVRHGSYLEDEARSRTAKDARKRRTCCTSGGGLLSNSPLAAEAAFRSADVRWQLTRWTSVRCPRRRSRRHTCGRNSTRVICSG